MAVLALTIVACGPPSPAGDASVCPPIEAACPDPAPSYAADIGPLVGDHCVVCHHAGSMLAPTDLSGYAQVRRQGGTILSELSSCMMPPAPQTPLTETERTLFIEWLRCGAPDN